MTSPRLPYLVRFFADRVRQVPFGNIDLALAALDAAGARWGYASLIHFGRVVATRGTEAA